MNISELNRGDEFSYDGSVYLLVDKGLRTLVTLKKEDKKGISIDLEAYDSNGGNPVWKPYVTLWRQAKLLPECYALEVLWIYEVEDIGWTKVVQED